MIKYKNVIYLRYNLWYMVYYGYDKIDMSYLYFRRIL